MVIQFAFSCALYPGFKLLELLNSRRNFECTVELFDHLRCAKNHDYGASTAPNNLCHKEKMTESALMLVSDAIKTHYIVL